MKICGLCFCWIICAFPTCVTISLNQNKSLNFKLSPLAIFIYLCDLYDTMFLSLYLALCQAETNQYLDIITILLGGVVLKNYFSNPLLRIWPIVRIFLERASCLGKKTFLYILRKRQMEMQNNICCLQNILEFFSVLWRASKLWILSIFIWDMWVGVYCRLHDIVKLNILSWNLFLFCLGLNDYDPDHCSFSDMTDRE